MKHVFRTFKQTSLYATVSALVIALVGSTVAFATPTVLVDPYDNLPTTGTSTLNVTGSGLVPGATVSIIQIATLGHTNGVYLEQLFRGSAVVDASGNLQKTITVTYDVRTDQTNITECNNKDSLLVTRQSCELNIFYSENYGTVASNITRQKLYFGMADPNKVTPPPAPVQPASKEDCREDKWDTFTTLGFKNQGACVSFVSKL